jgi:predicted short-subunit dehydrogenase-like oxidoreductase (DUF2520 family)
MNVPFTNQVEKILPIADIYFLLINDDIIGEFITKLPLVEPILVHSSGSLPLQVLSSFTKNYGVFYPLQSISKNKKVNFKNIPICIEANNNECLNILKKLAMRVSDLVYKIDSTQRMKLHLAAVFANNFSNHMITIAKKLLDTDQLSIDLLKPLILETAAKALEFGPENAQTGPSKRNDIEVMKKHLELLSCNPEWMEIYRSISKSIRDST